MQKPDSRASEFVGVLGVLGVLVAVLQSIYNAIKHPALVSSPQLSHNTCPLRLCHARCVLD